MKNRLLLPALCLLAACSAAQQRSPSTFEQITAELKQAERETGKAAQPQAVERALLPPLAVEMPQASGRPVEPKFDLVVNNAPANQVFMAIVSGTRYSMLVHPDVKDSISVNLKDVSVIEALDAIRELYGHDYKIQGTRIFIQPLALQTRVFQVNYLLGQRKGRSDVRVTSGSVSDSSAVSGATGTGLPAAPQPGGGTTTRSMESSRVTTSSDNDFWSELNNSLRAIVGSEGGRNVVINPQSGVIVVRAFPAELRNVESFLKTTQLVVERQVMLEAKIIEVQLKDGYQAGINWSAFKTGPNSRFTAGQIVPGGVLQTNGALMSGATSMDPAARTFSNPALSSTPGADLLSDPRNLGGLFGLAFQTSSFAVLLSFLETQGNTQVLSSPRIATLNNQKAVLKVGTDEFFVTNVATTSSTTSGTGTTTAPSATVTVQPFFSGIALDVMPQIDENNNIILHIHPSVSAVSEKTKNLDLGAAGSFKLPLASSNINETDSIVRVQDGNIVAIGGLMKQSQSDDKSQIPGLGDAPVVGNLFRQSSRASVKSELVILLKPTVIQSDRDWQQDILETRGRIQALEPRASRP